MPGTTSSTQDRDRWVRRGLWLNYTTIAYNSLEALVALLAGVVSGSVALIGFGVDSVIEVTASGAAQWRLRADLVPERRERVELYTSRIIGILFLVLAAYVLAESLHALLGNDAPDRSLPGLVLLMFSVIVMPVLARAKHRVASAIESRALQSEAKQTSLCAYLSFIALAGVGLNALVGWWWADPAAALVMVPIIALEGVEGIRSERG